MNRTRRFKTAGGRLILLPPGATMGIAVGLALGCLLFLPVRGYALGQERYVVTNAVGDGFTIVQGEVVAAICTDTNDFAGVLRAAGDLQADLARVSGRTPPIVHEATNLSANVIIAGTLGKSRLLDQLIRDGKIDASPIAGKWESFLIQVVPNPWPGVASALVIAGSDKRGTIYGIYDLSEQMGVSPWYWWADVPVAHRDALFVKPGRFVQGPPAVKYRGIFLNDEAPALTGFVKETFGDYNHGFYAKVFELLLRLKANYLWPAMWNNCFNEDDPLNPKLADEYGIVMGTSHVEPMMRADKEWNRKGFTASQWNYDKNPEALRTFWKEGIERNKNYENIITLAMRGKIDTPMSESANIALLEKIVADQRKIIADAVNTNLPEVPQLWALYKEVQEYYEQGMRVPDDVTLLWCDDNWGNLRRLPTAEERNRRGGAGIYYHFDYVGGPRNYKWLNTVPITKVWEQMNLAHQYGADRIWIVNVGDLKPMEFPMEFFLTLAWNPERWTQNDLGEYTRRWAEREFGPDHAGEIADIVSKYTKYNGRRKPELLEPGTFSLEHYAEADRVLAEWTAITVAAERISEKLPKASRDAFFQLVLYPTKACAIVNELYLAVARNRFYAKQGDGRANTFATRARELFKEDAVLANYFNHRLAGGKWNHMMDQTHIGYTYWQQPPSNAMPSVVEVTNVIAAEDSLARLNTATRIPDVSPPKDWRGFVEADGYISIEAEHFTKQTATATARWELLPDHGRTLSAMTIFPVTAPSVAPPRDSPGLEYQLWLTSTGKIEVASILSPSLNFVPGRGLRFAVSFDDAAPQILTAVPAGYFVDNGNRNWEESVKNNCRELKSTHWIERPGPHTLKIWMVDPGVVLQKIVVDLGGVKPSYLGPPESFRQSGP